MSTAATCDAAIAELALRYDCDFERLPQRLRQRFLTLTFDADARAFLERMWVNRPGIVRHELRGFLRQYASDFDVNGLLNIYPMHVLSTPQWRTLVPRTGGRLLDIGAGNGDTTQRIAPLFEKIVVTETSRAMAWRLRRHGFTCYCADVTTADLPEEPFDIITCLNVLDRCAQPLTLLERLHTMLKPDGILVIALVLPYKPSYYKGATITMPNEQLAVTSHVWEEAAVQFVTHVLEPKRWSVRTLSRVPYLSGGDRRQPFYELDDLIVVCIKEGAS